MYVLWPQTFGRTLLGRYIAVNIVLIKRKFPTDVRVRHKVVNIKYVLCGQLWVIDKVIMGLVIYL